MTTRPGIHDFDFLAGIWLVRNQRLRQRNVNCDEWDEFDGFSVGRPCLGGVVSIDEITFPSLGFSGFTFRTFDLARGEWSIYWVNSTSGVLGTPVVGGFEGEYGRFHGDDIDNGSPIVALFEWFRDDADHSHWQQSFSYDRGATWEVNWKNQLTRHVIIA